MTEARGVYEVMTAGERQFLLDAGAPADSFDPEVQAAALASLRARAELTRQQASPELSVAQVAERLDRSPSTIRRWAKQGDLFAVRGNRGLMFPVWQFPDGRRLLGLRAVLAHLSGWMHPYSVEGWMTSPFEELEDRSPVQWLAAGRPVEPVVWLAESEARV